MWYRPSGDTILVDAFDNSYVRKIERRWVKIAQEQAELTPQDVLHKRESDALGTNDGGWFSGSDGQRRYVKFYDDPAQANSEHLANLVYRGVGLNAPTSRLYQAGKGVMYASDEVPGEMVGENPSQQDALSLLRGFAADVLLANWDVIGLYGDNLVRDERRGVHRIDNGGALLTRGMGERKPVHLLMDPTEWDVFSGRSEVESAYADYFAMAGYAGPEDIAQDIARQINQIEIFRRTVGGWANFVETHSRGLSQQDKQRLIQMLDARSEKLNARAIAMRNGH
jgi:hypothetical protein